MYDQCSFTSDINSSFQLRLLYFFIFCVIHWHLFCRSMLAPNFLRIFGGNFKCLQLNNYLYSYSVIYKHIYVCMHVFDCAKISLVYLVGCVRPPTIQLLSKTYRHKCIIMLNIFKNIINSVTTIAKLNKSVILLLLSLMAVGWLHSLDLLDLAGSNATPHRASPPWHRLN